MPTDGLESNRCGFQYAPELLAALANPAALDYDPQPCGSPRAREAICEYYAEHGALVKPEQIILTQAPARLIVFCFACSAIRGTRSWYAAGLSLFDFLRFWTMCG